jgi:hypothetical protein
MIWLLLIPLQLYIIISGVRRGESDGTWSWSLFAFALGFIGFEVLILTLPLLLGIHNSHYFVPVYTAAWIVAAINFVWFLRVCRRWKPKPGNPLP